MSILSLPRQHLKHHSSSEGAIPVARRPRRADDTVPNLATYHAPPAAHLRQGERDETPLRFDNVTPDAPAAPVRPVRRELRPDAGRAVLAFLSAAEQHFSLEALTHGVELRSVPLERVPLADVDENVAAILAAVSTAPFARHEDAVAMALAPVVTLLAEPDPVTDWLYLLGAVESATLAGWSRLVTTAVRALDTIANVFVFATHQLHAEHTELLNAFDAELVDAWAALILVEVTL